LPGSSHELLSQFIESNLIMIAANRGANTL
jgi:hypothetical protein